MLELLKKAPNYQFEGKFEINEDCYSLEGDIVFKPKLQVVNGYIVIYLPPHRSSDGTIEYDTLEKEFELDVEELEKVLDFLQSKEFKRLWAKEDKEALEKALDEVLKKKAVV